MKFKLSIDEVGFALGFLGGTEVAARFLTTVLGPEAAEKRSGRLSAASHALIARDLLTVDLNQTQNGSKLAPDLQAALTVMATPTLTLHCTRRAGGKKRQITLFSNASGMTVHELNTGVVSRLDFSADPNALIARVVAWVAGDGLSDSLQSASEDMVATVPLSGIRIPRQALTRLRLNGVPNRLPTALADPLPAGLAADLVGEGVVWGAVMVLKPGSPLGHAPQVESEAGFLYATGPHGRCWLFLMTPENPDTAEVLYGTRQSIEQIVEKQLG